MSKTTYRVTASYGFDGHDAGEEFDAELDEALEARLIEAGLIEIKGGKSNTKVKEG